MAGAGELSGRAVLARSEVGLQGRRAALGRLRSAQGHLEAVMRMIRDERYCVDVLHQLAAVESAVAHARQEILEAHLRGCVAEAAGSAGVDVVEEVLAAVLIDRPPAARGEVRAVL